MKHILKGAAISLAVFALAGLDARAECGGDQNGESQDSCTLSGSESGGRMDHHGDDDLMNDDLMDDDDFMSDDWEFETDSCYSIEGDVIERDVNIHYGGDVYEGDIYEGDVIEGDAHYGDVYSETHFHNGRRMHYRSRPSPWAPPMGQLAPFDELDQDLDGTISQEEYMHYQSRTSGPATPPMMGGEEDPQSMMGGRGGGSPIIIGNSPSMEEGIVIEKEEVME